MCRAMEDMLKEDRKEIASRLLKSGKMTVEEIAEYCTLEVQDVKDVQRELLQST